MAQTCRSAAILGDQQETDRRASAEADHVLSPADAGFARRRQATRRAVDTETMQRTIRLMPRDPPGRPQSAQPITLPRPVTLTGR